MDENEVSNKAIYELLQNVLKKTDNIEQKSTSNTEELKQEIRNLNLEIKQELDILKRENEEVKRENQHLKSRLKIAESQLKKYNLVFYGITEEENRIDEIDSIVNLINEKIGVVCRFTDIRDYHRIGQKTQDKNRPIVIEFINYQLKVDILKNTKNLKGTRIFISKDYTPEEYGQQKVLRQNLKIARENNFTAQIKKNVLIVNGVTYTYEELVNQPVTESDGNIEQETTNNIESEIQNIQTQLTPKNVPAANCPLSKNKVKGEDGKKNFKDFINLESRLSKRNEQSTNAENQLKRSARLMKLNDEKITN